MERVKALIEKHNLEVEFLPHEEKSGLHTEDAAAIHGVQPDQILKVILLVDKKGKKVLAVVRGDTRIDTKKLRDAAGTKKLRFASPEEVEKALQYHVGGIPPFLETEIPFFVDEKVMEHNEVLASAGSEFTGMRFQPQHILKVNPAAKVADIAAG